MTVTIGAAAIAGALRTASTAAAAAPSRTLAFVTLITWLIDAGSGGYMLRTWIVRGGLRRQRAADRLAPRVVFGHFGMATTGLLVWLCYLATGWVMLSWLAVGLLMLVIGLGVSTVTLWTPFPAHLAEPRSAGDASRHGGRLTDETLNRALTDNALLSKLVDDVVTGARAASPRAARRTIPNATALIPAGHGLAAIATMILAVLTAVGAR
jgi:hypothetical protein